MHTEFTECTEQGLKGWRNTRPVARRSRGLRGFAGEGGELLCLSPADRADVLSRILADFACYSAVAE